ncbi:MAG: retroviral-like aspartic protease family protein [Oscillospiraceae bacterium]|nr:retroviral-like aspartic protease family protein [Oscillospiraceae bacterium]
MEFLEIKMVRELLYAPIMFWCVADNDYLSMLVLIDTGAAITTFSDSALKRLGYVTDDKSISIRTGGGTTTANEVIIPKIQIGSVELTNICAHSNRFLDEFKINGILGMNILSKFNFSVNFDESIISLKKRDK